MRGDRDNQGRLQEGRILCEGVLGRATSRNGKQRVNPTPYTVCGFFFFSSSPQLLVSFCPLLSWPISLPGFKSSPFVCSPLCHLLHLFGYHLLRDSTVPPPPHHFSLSSFFIATCCPFSPPPVPCLLSDVHLFPAWPCPTHLVPCCSPASRLLSGLSGGGSRGAGCEKAPPGRAPAPGLAPLRPSEPTMAVPPGHGPFSGFPGPQEHTQVCVQLALHLRGGGGAGDRRLLRVKDSLVAQSGLWGHEGPIWSGR